MTDDPVQVTLGALDGFLRLHEVDYAVIGGLAVIVRGQPRATVDVDVTVALTVDDAIRLLEPLGESGFATLFPEVEQVVRTAFLLPLRHTKTGVPIDVAIGVSGFESQLIQRASIEDLGSVRVPVASSEDLILMKLLAGRPQDSADVEHIRRRQAGRLDWSYLQETGRQLQQATDQSIVAQLQELRASAE